MLGIEDASLAHLRGFGDESTTDELALRHDALPAWNGRKVAFASIASHTDAQDYAKRFFHAAVTKGLRFPKGSPVRASWAKAAGLYLKAHNESLAFAATNQAGIALSRVRDTLRSADEASVAALKGTPKAASKSEDVVITVGPMVITRTPTQTAGLGGVPKWLLGGLGLFGLGFLFLRRKKRKQG